ncbi:hypothetical protein MS3_00001334 [Schistosoma haematobium]|uniref:Uncharacterized protein n=1 Tax=Schistosoma haematobium TaxID=6185 RepID=A0A922IGE1_SCHHA|nr:uncharacterized protein MS3_00001334 [Schistosoma haematobium]KAH9578563.1 hypothetical protein MS3_00001334 [Schistosoma haematobium]
MILLPPVTPMEKHRPTFSILHLILSSTILPGCYSSFSCLLPVFNVVRSSDFLFLSHPEFHVRACLVMQFGDFLSVCLIHLGRLFLIYSSAGSWFIFSYSSVLLIIFGQQALSILHRQLFISTCTFLMMFVVVLQLSAPYSRTPIILLCISFLVISFRIILFMFSLFCYHYKQIILISFSFILLSHSLCADMACKFGPTHVRNRLCVNYV